MLILSPPDEQDLIASGPATPVGTDGTFRLHLRRLQETSDVEYANLPLSPVSLEASTSIEQVCINIPAVLKSLANLKFLRYEDTIAD